MIPSFTVSIFYTLQEFPTLSSYSFTAVIKTFNEGTNQRRRKINVVVLVLLLSHTSHLFIEHYQAKRAQTQCPRSHKQGSQKAFYYSVYLLFLIFILQWLVTQNKHRIDITQLGRRVLNFLKICHCFQYGITSAALLKNFGYSFRKYS